MKESPAEISTLSQIMRSQIPPRNRVRILTTGIAVLVASLVPPPSAHAQDIYTWTGLGADDPWSIDANWSTAAAGLHPDGNDELHFAGATRLTPLNDINNYIGLSIFFDTGAGAFTLGGNGLTLSAFGIKAPLIRNAAIGTETVAMDVRFEGAAGAGAHAEIDAAAGDLLFNGAITLAPGGNSDLWLTGAGGRTVTFSNAIGGSGAVVLKGANTVVIYGAANTYAGDTFVNAGTLQVNGAGSLGGSVLQLGDTNATGAAATLAFGANVGGQTILQPIIVRAGSSGTKTIAAFNTADNDTIAGTLTLNASATTSTLAGGTLTLAGNINWNGNTNTILTIAGAGTSRITGNLLNVPNPGTSRIDKTGAATLVLDAAVLGAPGLTWVLNQGTVSASTGAFFGVPTGVNFPNKMRFTGGATFQAMGSFTLGDNSSGTNNAGIAIEGGSTATFDVTGGNTLTIAGVISQSAGTGSILKTGTGTLLVSQSNSFMGGATLSQGTTLFRNANALGLAGTVTLGTAATGANDISFLDDHSSGDLFFVRPVAVTNNGTGVATIGSSQNMPSVARAFFDGQISLGRSVTLHGALGDRTQFRGGITGTGDVVVNGGNRVIFSTTTAATEAGDGAAVYDFSGNLSITGAGTMLQFFSNVALTNVPVLDIGAGSTLALYGKTLTINALSGTGTITSTYSSGGTLTVGGNGASSVFNGSFTRITGYSDTNVIKNGGGTLTLGGTANNALNVLSDGSLIVNGGTLILAKASNSGVHAVRTVSLGNNTLILAGTGDNQIDGDGSVGLGESGVFDMNGRNESLSVIGGGAASLITNSAAGTVSILSICEKRTTTGSTAGRFSDGAGVLGLTVLGGQGDLVPFPGGDSITLNPSSSLGYTGPTTVLAGRLHLQLSAMANPTNMINPASVLRLGSGGLRLDGNGTPTSQSFNRLDLIGGSATLSTGSSNITINTGPITRVPGSTLDFSVVSQTTIQTPTGTANSLLTLNGVAFATAGYGWVFKDAANVGITGTTYTNDTWAPGAHTFATINSTQTNATTETLRFAPPFLNRVLTLAGTNVLNTGGIIDASAGDTVVDTITGGVLTSRVGELIVHGGGLAINSVIADSDGPVSLTKARDGTLFLGGANTYSGGTYIGSGSLTITASERIPDRSPVVFGGGTLNLNGFTETVGSIRSDYGLTSIINLNSGTLVAGADNSSTMFYGTISRGGSIRALGNFVKAGTGTLTLSGHTGAGAGLIILGGTVVLDYLGFTYGNPNHIDNVADVQPGATLRIAGDNGYQISANIQGNGVMLSGGTLDLNGRDQLLDALAGTGTVTNTALGASTLTVGYAYGANAFTGLLTDNAGTLALTTFGVNFALGGAHLYTGPTRLSGGILTIFSMANGGAASGVGASTKAASNLVFAGGALTYAGPSAFTDRDFSMPVSSPAAIEVAVPGTTLTWSGTAAASQQGFQKRGPGTLVFNGANTHAYTGTTHLQDGSLTLDLANIPSGSNLISGASFLFINSGKFTLKGKSSGLSTQSFSGASTSLGSATVQVDSNGGAGTTLALGSLSFGNGSINFLLGANTAVTTTTTNTNGILGPKATVAGIDWAASNAGTIGAFAAYGTNLYASGTQTNVTADVAFSAATTTGTLRFNTPGALTLSLDSRALTLAQNGILVTPNVGANTTTISGGTLLSPSGGDIIVEQYNSAGTLTIGAVIANNGASATTLVKAGPGTLVLTGANSYTGATRFGGGILSIGAISNLGTGILAMSGGTLRYTGASATLNVPATSVLYSAGGTFDIPAPTTTLTLTGGFSDAGSHVGSFTKTGAGILRLSSASFNTGYTTVNGGTLALGVQGAISPYGAGTIVNNGGTLQFEVAGEWNNIYYTLTTVNAGGTLTNNGAIFNALSDLSLNGGTLTSAGAGTPGPAAWGLRGAIAVNGSTQSTISGAGAVMLYNNVFNVMDGAVGDDLVVSTPLRNGVDANSGARAAGFTKTGAGTMTLAAGVTHLYTGPTHVVGGTLVINGADGASPVNVAAGGTLKGTGTTGLLSLNGGVLAPGNSAGTLHSNGLLLNGGTLALEISSPVDADQLDVTGTVAFNAPINLTLDFGYNPGASSDSFVIINNDGGDPISFANSAARLVFDGNLLDDGEIFTLSNTSGLHLFQINYAGGTGNDVVISSVPEPSIAALLAGVLPLFARLRRRDQEVRRVATTRPDARLTR